MQKFKLNLYNLKKQKKMPTHPESFRKNVNMSIVNISKGDEFLSHAKIQKNRETGTYFTNATQVADPRVLEKMSQTITKTYEQEATLLSIFQENGIIERNLGVGQEYWSQVKVSAMEKATISRTGKFTPEDSVDFEKEEHPIICVSKRFSLDWRNLDASRLSNAPLDMTYTAAASEAMVKTIQELIVQGSAEKYSGRQIFGFGNYTYKNNYVIPNKWGLAATTPQQIKDDINKAIGILRSLGAQKNLTLLVSNDIYSRFGENFNAYQSYSLLNSVLNYPEITRIESLPESVMPNGEFILFAPEINTIELGFAQDVTLLDLSQNEHYPEFMLLAVMAVNPKSDVNGKSRFVIGK